MNPRHALALSLASGLLALSFAGAFAQWLQARTRLHSHEQPPWTGLPVPAGATPETLRATGRKLFVQSCAHCHGIDARGDEGPDLHGLNVSDRRIATVVRGGIPHEMPSFAKKHKTEDIAALIAYLRTLE
ncbi:MAG: c-type cytochrome [Opitutales bacterium]